MVTQPQSSNISNSELSCASFPSHTKFSDSFLERRFADNGEINLPDLIKNEILSFLSKTTQRDEYYYIQESSFNIDKGLYRIRQEGSQSPLVTIKVQGDGQTKLSATIDIVNPDHNLIENLRKIGELVAVVEKDRNTYKSRQLPNCLLHFDSVRGLGNFLDVKADSSEVLETFISQLGLKSIVPIKQSYLAMKEQNGLDPLQLKVWKFHQRFQDYIMGVVSGTLTPLGFLSATIASGQSRSAMVVALMSAGFCDGISDSVANSQTTQSESRASSGKQIATFLKTMAGKVAIPFTFIPIVFCSTSNITTVALSLCWASLLLGTTATIQAIANERQVFPAVRRILAWGVGASAIGTIVGQVVEKVLGKLLGS